MRAIVAGERPDHARRGVPQFLAGGSLNAHHGMVESSRFCVDTTLSEGRGGGNLHQATLTMLAAIIEWSMANGYTEIVTATDLRFERIRACLPSELSLDHSEPPKPCVEAPRSSCCSIKTSPAFRRNARRSGD